MLIKRKSFFGKLIIFSVSLMFIFSSFAIPFGGMKNLPAVKADTSISATNTSLSTHVKVAADYELTITNNCANEDDITVSTSGTATGWTVDLLDSNDSTTLNNPITIPGNGTHTIYVHITPSASVCNDATDTTTVKATSAGNNGCSSGSSSVDLTTTAINTGNLVITKSVSPDEAKVGDTVTWTIHIKNTGNDPIGNVTITDTLGSGSTYNNDINFNGHNPDSGGYPQWKYNEIQIGDDYTVTFSSTISGCSDVDNNLSGKWGLSGSECQNVSTLASVKLIPTAPDIDYTISDISVPYCGSTNVDIPITNSGDGIAKNFKLKIDKIPDFYTISNIGSDWSYNSSTGEFTYLVGTPSGAIQPNTTVHLTFTVTMPSGHCDTSQGNATLKYTAEYGDPCGNAFYNPSKVGTISVTNGAPYFDLTKTGPRSVNIGQTGLTYTINVTYHKGNCSADSQAVDITDTLPAPFIPQSADNGGTINGQTVTWSNITLSDGSQQTFHITFNVTDDSCDAHKEYTNTVNLSGAGGGTLTDCCNCPISGTSASFNTYVNDPASTIVSSSKSADNPTIEIDCSQDTGAYTNPSGNSDSHNDRRYTTEYDFVASNVYAPTTWNGITFTDELQDNQYTNDSIANIDVEVDCGSGFTQVDSSYYTVNSYVPLKIDLSNLDKDTSICPPSDGAKLKISYTARATQTNDSNNSAVSQSYVDWSHLYIPGFPRGCNSNTDYDQGIDVTDERADLGITVDVPQTVEKCAEYPTITVHFNPSNFNVDYADLTVTLNGFTYVANSTTYSDSGNWCSGSKGEPTYDSNNNTLTWSASQINEINASGTITFNVKKDCSDNASVSATSDYKDNCGKDHSASSSDSAVLIKKAVLYTTITPQQNWGATHTVDWKIYVTNGGDGTAREITISNVLGSDLSFNSDGCYVDIDGTTYNYGDSSIDWPSNGATGTLVWKLNNLTLAPSQKITIYFKTDVNSCTESNLTSEAYAKWCNCQESNHPTGLVKLPHSYALVTIENATVPLCDDGTVQIKIQDPGSTDDYNVILKVDLPKYLRYKSGSGSYSYNSGASQTLSDPSANSISGGDYDGGWELTWDKTKIAEFGDMKPNDYITLNFNVEPDDNNTGGQYPYASCKFMKSNFQKIEAFANFAKPCNVNNSDQTSNIYETNFTTQKPDLSMTKKVINIDGTDVSSTNYFPEELGSQIIFEVDITNNGDLSTVKTDFADELTGTNQHPLDYGSAQYSYDGGTSWTTVPWDSAPSAGSSGTLIWNNIEDDLGHGIESGKTLKIQIKATVDSNCTSYNAYNYSELWTGCSDLGDMTDSNLLGSATTVSGWNGSLTADCPIYQAKYARVVGHKRSWDMEYGNNIPDYIPTCAQDVEFEIEFDNGNTYNGGTTIYAPLTVYDVIPKGATYVSGSTEFMLPGGTTWTSGSDPAQSTVTFSNSHYGWNGDFTQLEWNSTNNSTLGTTNVSPGQYIKVRFKLNFGNCSDVSTPIINRQRLTGYDCNGSSGTQFLYPEDPYWSTDDYYSSHYWIKVSNKLSPDISIDKTVDKSNASPGDTLLYEIHLKNTGNSSSDTFSITDSIPSGTALVPGSITDGPPPGTGTAYNWVEHSYDSGNGTITWFSSSIGIAYDDITGDGNQVDASDICLTDSSSAVGTAYKNDGDSLRHTANGAVYDDVDNSGDVSSGDILLAGPKEDVGTPFTGTDSLRHSGTSVYDDVDNDGTVSSGDILIAGIAVIDGTPYDSGPDVLRHTEHGVPASTDTTLSFRVAVLDTASGTITNCATFTDDCCYNGNNAIQDCVDTNVQSSPIKVTKSVIAINGNSVSGRPYNVQPGDNVTFRIKVQNNGGLPVYNVDVYDTLPNGWNIVTNTSKYALTNGSLPSTWISTADPHGSPYDTPPTPPPNFSGLQWHIQQTLQATDDNGGSTGGNNDTLYLEFTAKVTTSASASPTGEYNLNSADTAGTNDQAGSEDIDRDAIDLTDATDWVLVYKPELLITKNVYSVNGDTNNTTKAQPGDIVRYKITVKNTAAVATAVNVNVTDTLPNGFNYVSGSSSATWSNNGSSSQDPSISGNTLSFNYNATINAGDSLVIYFNAEVTSNADIGKNTNSASAEGEDEDGGSVSATSPDGSANAYADINVYKPVLRIEKTSNVSHIPVGTSVTFTIKVENLDSYAEAKNINITDTLPSGWNYVSNSSYKVINNGTTPANWGGAITDPTITNNPSGTTTLNFNLSETLQPTDDQGTSSGSNNDTLWLKFDATPTNSALGCGNTDTATASYTDKAGTAQSDVSDSANVCVCSPKLEMTKIVDDTTAEVNESRTFTLKIENKNPEDATNVNVYDYLPDGWAYDTGSGKYALTNGSLPLSWTNQDPSQDGYTLIWNINVTVKGTDDNGGTTGGANDTLFVQFKAHPTTDAAQGINTNRAMAEGTDSGGNPIGTNVGEASVMVNKPVITISKTATSPVGVLGTITYTITVTNTGNEDLTNATITDTLPDGVTYQSSSGGSYNSSNNTVTFTGLTVPQGGSIQKQITVTVNKNVPKDTVLTNSATVSGSDSGGNTITAGPATADTTVEAPSLSITKQASPNPVKAGENVTYTITVTNNGNQNATNVTITDNVPAHTTFVSADNNGTLSGSTVTWNVGTVAAATSTTVHFTVKVDSPIDDNTVITNSATVDSNEEGPITSNETQTVVSSVPQLNICKSDSQDPVKPGNEFTYTIRYANNSTMDITNVVITENYPAGITFVSASPAPDSGTNNKWTIGTLTAGSSGNITITVQVNSDVSNGTILHNTVTATSDNTPDATATEDTTVGTAPALTISKSDDVDPVSAGQDVTYTIHYANTGSQDATGVVIEDDYSHMLNLPLNPSGSADASLVSHSETGPVTFTFTDDTTNRKWIWTANGSLPGNSSGSITIKVHIPDNVKNNTTISDSATISSNEGNPATDTEQTTIASAPVLNLSKDAVSSTNPATPGGTITYTLNYSNSGNEYATNVEITDAIPEHTSFVVNSVSTETGVTVEYSDDNGASWGYTPSDSGDGTDPNVTNIKFIVNTLTDDGTNHAASFEVKIDNPLNNGTTITNSASITCSEGVTNSATNELVVGAAPALHITKSAPGNVNAGDNITYTIEYWNDGNMNATGVVITESYDPNVEFVSANPAPDNGTNNQWTIGTVNNDAVHHTITVIVKVKAPTPNGTSINNAVTIDSDQTNPSQATVQTTVGSAPTLTIHKTDAQDPVKAGENIIYTITVGNTGNENATNVVITDSTPPNTTFVSARFITKSGTITDPGAGNTGTIKWTLTGALAPNEEFAVELIVKTDSPLDNGTVIHNTAHVSCVEDQAGKDATEDTTIESAPILSIDKVDLQDPVQAGDSITYHITVTNSGNMNATNVVITDYTPQNTTFVSASFVSGGTGTITDPGVGNAGTVQWNLTDPLNAGGSLVVKLVVKTNSPLPNGTVINNTASVKSDEVSSISADENTTIGSAPKLTITKTDSPDPVQAGDNITYTITVTNTGNMDATNVIITDEVPSNTTFISARFVTGTGTISAPSVGGTGVVNWTPTPDTLHQGESVVVELVVKTHDSLPNGTIITNTAYVDSAEITHLPATQQTTVGGTPILEIDKTVYPVSGAPGKLMIYAINYRNVGNAPATNVTITESLPAEVEFYFANPSPTSGNNTWVIPVLEKGVEGSITVVVKIKDNVPLGTIVQNVATISSNETPTKQAQANFEVKAPNFWDPQHIYQRKVVSPQGNVAPGTWLTYTNYYGNSGNADATNVTITDTLDTNLDESTLIINNNGTYDPVSRTITWVIPVVHPGETGSVSFRVMVRRTVKGMTPIANTSYIKCKEAPVPVMTNTVYNTIFAPCPVCPTNPPKPAPPNPISITINPPERICINTNSKFVFTFAGGTPPYQYVVDFGDGTEEVKGKESGKFITLLHNYTAEGTYTVVIDIKDSKGQESRLTRSVKAENCEVVLRVYHHNFIIGYPDGNFKSERKVTRAEIATMLTRALGLDALHIYNYASPFSDVTQKHWAFNFIKKANEEKLMLGDKKGTFRPDSFATRAEIATILVRLRGLKPEAPEEQLFSDVSSKDWFNGYIYTAVKAGLIQGYPDHTFKPNKSVTRAEFVTMLDRALYREDIPQIEQSKGLENIKMFPDVTKDFWAYRYILEAAFPHVITYATRAPINISIPTKAIPIYLASTKTVIIFPKLNTTITAIVPVDSIQNGKDPEERNVYVRIINKEKP